MAEQPDSADYGSEVDMAEVDGDEELNDEDIPLNRRASSTESS